MCCVHGIILFSSCVYVREQNGLWWWEICSHTRRHERHWGIVGWVFGPIIFRNFTGLIACTGGTVHIRPINAIDDKQNSSTNQTLLSHKLHRHLTLIKRIEIFSTFHQINVVVSNEYIFIHQNGWVEAQTLQCLHVNPRFPLASNMVAALTAVMHSCTRLVLKMRRHLVASSNFCPLSSRLKRVESGEEDNEWIGEIE